MLIEQRGGKRPWERSCRLRLRRHLEEPRSPGYVQVRILEIDMFSSSTAARRPTEISTEVTLAVRILRSKSKIFRIRYRTEEWKTLDSSGSRFSCVEIRKVDVKHSVMSSISVDAEVAVPIKARQLDSSVETDEQDSEMSS